MNPKTIIIFNPKKKIISLLHYNNEGRLIKRREYDNVSYVEFKRSVSTSAGLESNLIVYTIDGEVLVEKKGTKILIT